ncbi:MAG: hypothetical protein IJ146_10975 [Kiritimatiellae bacterium]|nr:hypothetical protein [Kiritimatiellia bacterium]
MIDQERINEYWKRTEQTLSTFEGLKRIGFFEAPASKGHHLAVAGGLAEHSIHVTDNLLETRAVPEVSAYRIGMYHDLVKCLCYKAVGGGKYEYTQPPYPGHGVASAMIAADIGIRLEPFERAAIVWHMGAFGLDERQMAEYKAALRKWPVPIIFTHAADHLASILEEAESEVPNV